MLSAEIRVLYNLTLKPPNLKDLDYIYPSFLESILPEPLKGLTNKPKITRYLYDS